MRRFKNILAAFNFPARMYFVECHYGQTGAQFSLVLLRKVKDELKVDAIRRGDQISPLFKDLEELPIALLVTGRKVLSKRTSARRDLSKSEVIQKAFPNVAVEDLVGEVQVIEGTDQELWVSVIRKDTITEMLREWPQGCFLLDLRLGVYSLWSLFEKLGSGKLNLGSCEVDFVKEEVSWVGMPEKGKVEAFGEALPSHASLAFIYGLKVFASGNFESVVGDAQRGREDWMFDRYYQFGLRAGGALLFAMLLVSFWVFSTYSQKVDELSMASAGLSQQSAQLDKLKLLYAQKQEFLAVNGRETLPVTQMADQLAVLVPAGVTLELLDFHPFEKRLKKENLVQFARNEVLIKGENKGHSAFQHFIADVKDLVWVSGIEILGYEEDDKGNKAHFAVRVILKT